MATIYIVKGPNDGDAYTLKEDTIIIGRGNDCGITLDDDKTSRSHVQICYDPKTGKHVLEDLRSTNGTWCNGKSITGSTVLAEGDVFELGITGIEYSASTFESNEAAAAARTSRIKSSSNMTSDSHTMIDDSNKLF